MANKKKENNRGACHIDAPQHLNDSTFFGRLGFKLSDEQIKFRDAIYNPNNNIVFVNARAGSGKTVIAMATACCMVEYGLYDSILYCFSLNNGFQNSLGLLPGGQQDKEMAFYEPCLQALVECGYFPAKAVKELVPEGADNSQAFVSCRSHTFLRGTNIDSRTILILDECQNFYADEIKKVLTRVKDGAKVIVIGHNEQCDIISHPERTGFVPYLQWFEGREGAEICELKENYRGWISRVADDFNLDKLKNRRKSEAEENESD
jgi:PhoH-like ATPase